MSKINNYIYVLIDINTGKQFFNDILVNGIHKIFTPKIENKIHKVYCERVASSNKYLIDTFSVLYIDTPGGSRIFINKYFKIVKMGSNTGLVEINKDLYDEIRECSPCEGGDESDD